MQYQYSCNTTLDSYPCFTLRANVWGADPETDVWLQVCAQADMDENVRQLAVQELVRGWKDDPDTLTILKARAQADENVRRAAVQELERGWGIRPKVRAFID